MRAGKACNENIKELEFYSAPVSNIEVEFNHYRTQPT
jgi:hypothetical protein